ncbi:MAG: sugar phosphate isomerase/epimerase family protein [Planctomycetota bacterium]|jgi:sugar phosphate isomerase/epimerase
MNTNAAPLAPLRLGYNTNGLAHHRLEDGLDLLSELGYEGVALTLDVHHLDPFRATTSDLTRLRDGLERRNLTCVIETGARYLLDPTRKHHPPLSHEDRHQRLGYLERAVTTAQVLGAEAVTFFSGVLAEGVAPELGWRRVAECASSLLAFASEREVTLGFEPEPGHLVSSLADYDRLRGMLDHELGLTLDLGHVACTETCTIPEAIRRYADRLKNVHIEDIRGRVHEHLLFGDGDLDIPAALAALREVGYRGLVNVELSRHSHMAVEAARRSIQVLREQ